MILQKPVIPAPLYENDEVSLAPNAQAGWMHTPTGKIRYATWPAAKPEQTRGTIILAHGLSEQIEKYQPAIKKLVERNFAVAMTDWRGHGLSDNCPPNAYEDFTVRDADMNQFMREIVLDHMPKPYIGMGHSMGGCLMLCAIHEHQDWFDAGVLCSPMLGIGVLERHPSLKILTEILAPFMTAKQRKRPKKQSRHTSNKERFATHQRLLKQYQQLLPKFHFLHWVRSANRRLRVMQADGWYASIETPILVFVAGRERLVYNESTYDAVTKMQQAEIVEIDQAWHEILMEQKKIQDIFWRRLDKFLAVVAPPVKLQKIA